MNTTTLSKYKKAKVRVASIRGFYNYLAVFIILNIILYLLRNKFTFILINDSAFRNPEFLEWIDWNVFGTTVIWGVVLAVHGAKAFTDFSSLTKEW